MKQTIEQRRAADSLAKINRIRQKDEQQADDYATYVTHLPMAILQNGLGQALAQLNAAGKQNPDDPHIWLLQDIQSWLCKPNIDAVYPDYDDIFEAITKNTRVKYVRAMQEAIAWLMWHKKLATAYLKKPEGENT
jgi:CRISPR-associated protein Cmr5